MRAQYLRVRQVGGDKERIRGEREGRRREMGSRRAIVSEL
jgi:hypothetical protein